MTQRPEVVDDFVRNFLVRMNMDKTLECFQTEWYICYSCVEKYSTVEKIHNKTAWCLLSTGLFLYSGGGGGNFVQFVPWRYNVPVYRQIIEKHKVFKIRIFVSIFKDAKLHG